MSALTARLRLYWPLIKSLQTVDFGFAICDLRFWAWGIGMS